MNKQLPSFIAAALLCLSLPALAQNVAIVNGKPVSKSRVDAMVKQVELQAATSGRPAPPDLAARVREEIIKREVFTQAAKSRGLDATDDYKAQLDNAREVLLINALRDDYIKTNPVSDAELQAEYDKLATANSGKEYKVRHILVPDEDLAKKLTAALKKGAKFEDLAKKESTDPGSKANGGDLNWTNASGLVAEFSTAMVKLKKGETTAAPVKTQFGWHIIRLDDVRDMQMPKLADIKPQLAQQLQQVKVQQYMEGLSAKAKIE